MSWRCLYPLLSASECVLTPHFALDEVMAAVQERQEKIVETWRKTQEALTDTKTAKTVMEGKDRLREQLQEVLLRALCTRRFQSEQSVVFEIMCLFHLRSSGAFFNRSDADLRK